MQTSCRLIAIVIGLYQTVSQLFQSVDQHKGAFSQFFGIGTGIYPVYPDLGTVDLTFLSDYTLVLEHCIGL